MSAKNRKIQLYLRRLIRELCGAPDVDINDALATAQLAHLGQRRRSGEEYIEHPKEVAQIVYNYYQDPVLCAAALLHDTLEDAVAQGNAESDEEMASLIAGSFGDPELGDDVLRLVRSLTHEKSTDYTSYLINLASDPQALKVKLADVLHNLSSSPSEKQLLKYKTALAALRAEYGEPPAGISGAHWEALKNIVKLDAPVKDMREVILRKYVREVLTEASKSGLPGLQRNLVQDLLLGKYEGRHGTGEMGEEYAELFFGTSAENTNPQGYGAGGDSEFADIVVGKGTDDAVFYSVKASTPGVGKSATAGSILGNAKIKPSSLAAAIKSGDIPVRQFDDVTQTPDGPVRALAQEEGTEGYVVVGAVAFGLETKDHPKKESAPETYDYPVPVRLFTYIWTAELPVVTTGTGTSLEVLKIADSEAPFKGNWGATAMNSLFGAPETPPDGNVELTDEQGIKYGDEVFERHKGKEAISDSLRKLRIAGQKIANAIEQGEAFDEQGQETASFAKLKDERARLEKNAEQLDKIVNAISHDPPKEFEVTVIEALVREILREDAK